MRKIWLYLTWSFSRISYTPGVFEVTVKKKSTLQFAAEYEYSLETVYFLVIMIGCLSEQNGLRLIRHALAYKLLVNVKLKGKTNA